MSAQFLYILSLTVLMKILPQEQVAGTTERARTSASVAKQPQHATDGQEARIQEAPVFQSSQVPG